MIKKLILFIYLLLIVLHLTSDASDDKKAIPTIEKYKEILIYGIEEEIINILDNLGYSPNKEIYSLLTDRYKESLLPNTKIALINYFLKCDNLPESIITLLYEETKNEPENLKVHTTLLNFLGKKGNKEHGLLLIERLDSYENLIKSAAAEALSEMNNQEIAVYILKRLEESETNNEKFLSDDIKSRLILALGKMKSKESVGYLKKILSDSSNDKFLIMYSMVSLAEIQDVDSINIINENLNNSEIKIQEYAGYALSKFKINQVIPILKKMLKHNNENIRIFACQGIVLNNDLESVNILLYKFKNDPSIKVKNEALKSLVYLGNNGITTIKNYMKDNKLNDEYIQVISEAVTNKPDNTNVDYLISIFDSSDDKKKEIISKNIVKGTSNKVDPILNKLLNSKNQYIRVNAIKAVYNIKDSTLWIIVKQLSENDPSELVKKTAKFYLDLRK